MDETRVNETGLLRVERGVWVFYTGEAVTASETDKVFDDIRTERDRINLGLVPGS